MTGTCESELLLQESPVCHTANVHLTPEQSLEVSLTQPATKEGEFVEQESVSLKTANTSLPSTEALIMEEIVASSGVDEYITHQPSSDVARLTFTNLESHTVSEIKTGEVESELELPLTPNKHKPDFSVTSQETLTISQVQAGDLVDSLEKSVVPQEKYLKSILTPIEPCVVEQVMVAGSEVNLEICDQPKGQEASPSYETLQTATVAEVVPDYKEEFLEPEITSTSLAKVTLPPEFSLEVSDTVLAEHEHTLKDIPLPKFQTAEGLLPSTFALSIRQNEISDFTSPAVLEEITKLEEVADIQVTSNHPVSISETASELREVDLRDAETALKKANVSILENITTSVEQIAVCDTSGDLKPDLFPTAHRADTRVIPQLSVSVGEIHWDQKEDVFEKEKLYPQDAKTDITLMRALEISECSAQTKEQILLPQIMPEVHEAKIDMPSEEAVSVIEVNTDEKARKLSLADLPKQDVARMEMSLFETVLIEEQKQAEKESVMDIKEMPQSKTALKVLPVEKHLEVSEVNAAANYEPLIAETPKQTTADVLLSPRQCLVVSETTSGVKEDILVQMATPKTHKIEPEFPAVEPLYISTTESEAREGELTIEAKPKESQANVNFSAEDSVQISEIQTNLKEGVFVPSEPAVGVTAPFSIPTMEHVLVSEVQMTSHEKELQPAEQPKSFKADLSLSSESHVVISEIETQLKEEQFVPKKMPKEVSIGFTVPEEEHILISQVDSEFKEDVLKPDKKPADAHADVQIPTEEHIVISKVVTDLKEGTLEVTQMPQTASAVCSFPTEQHVNVSDVVTSQKEGRLQELKIPDTITAPFTLATEKHVTVSQTEVSLMEGEFIKEKVPETVKANLSVPSAEHVVVSMTSSGEFEDNLSVEKLPKALNADFSVPTEEHVVVSEVQAPISEDILTPDKKPLEFSAEQTLTLGEHILVSEVETANKEALLEEMKKPKTDTAGMLLNTEEHVLVSVVQANVSEEEYVCEKKPLTQNVKVSVPTDEHVTVFEVTSVSSEKDLPQDIKPSSAQADFTVLTEEHVLTSTVETSLKEEVLVKDKMPVSVTATSSVPSESHVIVSSTETEDKETEFVPVKLPTQVQLDYSLATSEHVIVGEIVSETSEKEMKPQVLPGTVSADMSLLKEEHVTVSEVLTDVKEGEISAFKAPATVNVDYSIKMEEHVIVGKVDVQTKENELAPTKLPSTVTADFSVLAQEHVEISEVPVQVKERDLPADKSPQTATAKVSIPSQEHVSISDVQESNQSEELSIAPSPLPAEAEVHVPSESHVIVSETVTSQKEGEVTPLKRPQEIKAGFSIPTAEHVIVSDVIISNREKDLVKEKETPMSTADFSIPGVEHVIISQVQTENREEEFKLQAKPSSATADFSVPTVEHVVTSETELHMKESELDAFKKPKESHVSITVPFDEHVEIQEVEIDVKEKEFIPDKSPATMQASFTLPTDEHVTVIQTELHHKEETLSLDSKPSSVKADFSVSTVEHVVVSEAELGLKEEKLDTFKRPKESHVDVTVPAEEHIEVCEVEIEMKEKALIPDKIPATVQAAFTVPTDEHVVVMQTESHQKEDTLNLSEKPLSVTADFSVPTVEHIVISETELGVKETELDVFKKPKESYVDVTVPSEEHIEIHEVEIDMKEKSLMPDKMPATVQAAFTVPTDEHVIIMQTESHQKEDILAVQTKPSSATADFSIPTVEHVVVSETELSMKETELDSFKKPKESHIDFSVPVEEHIEICEVEIDVKEKALIPEKMPATVQAAFTVPTDEHVVIMQTEPHQKEDILSIDERPTEVSADLTVSAKKHVVVSQVLAETKEEEFITKDFPKRVVADLSVSSKEHLIVTETVYQSSEKTLKSEESPLPVTADYTVPTKEHIEISQVEPDSREFELTLEKKPKEETAGVTIPTESHFEVSEIESHIKPEDMAPDKTPRSMKADVTVPTIEHVIVSETESNLQVKEFSTTKPSSDKAKQTLAVREPIKVDEVPGEVCIEQQVTLTKKREKPKKKDADQSFVDFVMEEAAEFVVQKPKETIAEIIEETPSLVIKEEKAKDVKRGSIPDQFSPFTVTLPEEENVTEESSDISVTKKRTVKVHKKMKGGKIVEVKEVVETFSSVPFEKSKPIIEDITETESEILEPATGKEPVVEEIEELTPAVIEKSEMPEEISAVVEEVPEEKTDESMVTIKKKPKKKTEKEPLVRDESSEEETDKTVIKLKKKKSIVEEIEIIPAPKIDKDEKEQIISIPHIETMKDNVEILIEESEDVVPKSEAKVKKEGPEVFISEVSETKTETPIIPVDEEDKKAEVDVAKVKLKKGKKPISEEVTKPLTDEKKPIDDTFETTDIKLKPKKKPKDIAESEITLEETKREVVEDVKELIIEEKPVDDKEETTKIKLKPKKPLKVSDEVTFEAPKQQEPVEEETKPFTVEKKPLEDKESTTKITLKPKKKVKATEEPEVVFETSQEIGDTESVTLKPRPKRPTEPEKSEEETVKVTLKPKEIEEIETTLTPKEEKTETSVSIKRKPKKEIPSKKDEETVTVIKPKVEVPEKIETETIDITLQKTEEESVDSVEEIYGIPKTVDSVKTTQQITGDQPTSQTAELTEVPEEIVKLKKKPLLPSETHEETLDTVTYENVQIKQETREIKPSFVKTEETVLSKPDATVSEEAEIIISKPVTTDEVEPQIADTKEEKVTFTLKKKPSLIEEPSKPIEEVHEEITLEKKPSVEEAETVEHTVKRIKKKPKEEPIVTEESKIEAVVKIKKKPKEEKPVETVVERKPSIKEEEKPEEVTEKAVLKIKKKPTEEEEKPVEAVIETQRVEEVKIEEVSEKAVVKIKKREKEELETIEAVIERKPKEEPKKETHEEHAVLKIKKKPKEKPVESVVEKEEPTEEKLPEEVAESAVITIKKKPEEEKPVEAVVERKVSVEEVKKVEIEEKAVIKIKRKPSVKEEEVVETEVVLPKQVVQETVETAELIKIVKEITPEEAVQQAVVEVKRKPSIKTAREGLDKIEPEDAKEFSLEPTVTDKADESLVKPEAEEKIQKLTETDVLKSEEKPEKEKTTKITLKKKPVIKEEKTSPVEEFKIPLKPETVEEKVFEETEETFSLSIQKPKEPKVIEEEHVETIVIQSEETKYTIEEATADLKIKKQVIIEEPVPSRAEIDEIPEVEEKVKIKRKPKKEEPVSEEVKIVKKPEQITEKEDVVEEFKVELPTKPATKEAVEETTIKLVTTEMKQTEVKVEEQTAELTVKKFVEEVPEKPKFAEVKQEEVPKEKSPEKEEPKVVEKPVEEKVKLKRKPKVKEEPVSDTVQIPLKPIEKEPEKQEEVEETFKVELPKKPEQKEIKVEEATVKLTVQDVKEEKHVVEEKAEITVKKVVEEPKEEEVVKTVKMKKKPKKPEEQPEEVVEFKIPEKPKEEEKPEEVEEVFELKIKPKEEEKVQVEEETAELIVLQTEKPQQYTVTEEKAEVVIKKKVEVEEVDEKVVFKKKKTPKVKDTPDTEVKITLEEKKPIEPESVEEVEEAFTIRPKKKEEKPTFTEEVEEVFKIPQVVEKKEYSVTEETAEITVKKKVVEEDVGEVKITQKKKKPKVKEEEPAEFKITLDEKKPEKEPEEKPEDVEETFAVKIPKKEPVKEVTETVEDVVKIEIPKPVKVVEEEAAEITIKKEVPVEKLPEEEKPETTVIKRKKKVPERKKSESPVEETFAVPLKEKREPSPEDVSVEEKFTVGLKKPEKKVVEEAAEETVKLTVEEKKVTEYKKEEVAAEITVKKVVEKDEVKEPIKKEEVEVTKKLKLKKKVEPKPEEKPIEETFAIPVKKEEPVKEESPVQEAFSVKLKEKITAKEEKTVEESFKLVIEQEKPKPKEEVVAEEATVVLKPKEEPKRKPSIKEEVEEKATLKLKPKKKEPEKKPEEPQETFRIPKKPEEEKPKPTEEKPVEEAFKVTIPKKQKVIEEAEEEAKIVIPAVKDKEYTVTDVSEEVTIKKVVEEKEETVSLKKRTDIKKKETVSEEFKITKKREEVTEKVEEPEPAEFKVDLKKPKLKPKEVVEEEDSFKVTIPKKQKVIEEAEEEAKIVIPAVKDKEYTVTDVSEEVTIKKVVEEKEETVSLKKRTDIKKKETVSEEFKITKKREEVTEKVEEPEPAEFKVDLKKPKLKPKEVVEEEDSLKLKIPEKKKPEVTEENVAITVKKKVPVDEKKIVEEEQKISIKKPKKKVEVEEESIKESFTVSRKKSIEEKETVEDVEESFQIKTKPKKKPQVVSEDEESLSISLPSEKPEYKTEDVSEETSVTLRKEAQEEDIIEILETTEYVAISSFVSEKTDSVTLVEGERVQVIEKTSQDWWFVRKVVTNEKGFVPPSVLQDSATYTHYMKDTLSKKIEKLPVLRKPKPGEKMTAPKFVKKLTPMKVTDGQTAEISCQVTGNPRPTITWFKQTQIIKPSMEFQIFYDEDNVTTLIIREVFPEDAGTYTVVAKNAAGFASCSADLLVDTPFSDHGSETFPSSRLSLSRQSSLADILEGIPPVFAEKPKDKKVDEGKPVELVCKVTGIPEPKITWLRNQKPLKESDRVEITTVTEDLDITKVIVTIKKAKVEDAGTYEIIAENREGKSVTSLILNVTEKPKKPKEEPPIFSQTYSDVICSEKDTVSLTVKVQGTPPPEVTWYKNGKELKPSKNVTQTVNKDVHILTVSDTKEGDTGDYKCVAKNPKGTVEHTAKVTVQKTGVDFVEKLYDVEVKERESALFVIEVSHPTAKVTWHKDGEQLKPNDRIKFVEDDCTRKLIIEDANVNDEGEYTCVLGEKECTAELVVVELPPDFKGEMKDVTVAKEQSASFQVELTKGDARARWFKNGKEIDFSEHVMLKIDGKRQKLIIYNATFEDAGTYTCVVGNKKRTANLKVEAPTVEFTAKLPDKMTVPQDTDVSFTVQLSRPDVPVQWLKNGQPVPEKEKDKFQFIKEKNVYKMVVRRAQKDDAAEYSCVAGNVKTTTKLQVQEAHAEFTLKLRDVIVRESDTATLLVEVTRETFEVRWMKDGQTLKPTDRVVMEKEGCRRRLIIKETMLEDRGMYTCVLEEKTCSSTLTVESTPRVVSEKRHFKVKRGGNVVVDVEFLALPQPKIEWLYKGKTVSPDKKRTVENYGNKTVLTIKKVDDSDVGNYTLKLSNKCGECKTDFTVSIIDKPKPPGMPNASEIGDTSLTLSWKVPDSDGGSPITNYLIEYHDRNTLRWSTYNEKFTIDQPFSKVDNLKKGEEYMFRVIAVNEVGKSDPSPGTKYILVQEPKAGEPPAIVEHLKPVTCGIKKSATMTCRISGQPPPTIKWLKNGKDLLVLKNITTTYENQIATMKITETTEKSAGTYTCKATNPLGTVETSSELKIQEPPTIHYDESMKNVRLKSYSEYVLNIKVFGYPSPELVWFKNGKVLESTKHTLVQVKEDSTTITIRSVENTDSATYTLQLTNSAGTVKYDFRLFVLDKPLPPEGPIAFHKIEKNSVTIGWQPPSIGGSEVISYIIEKCETRRKVWIEVATVKSDVLTQEITELSEGIEYAFRVIATNEYGRSDPLTSDPVAPKSLFDKPHAPKGPFTTSNMTENSFTLSWLAPDNDGGSPIVEYIVERKEATRKAWQRVATTDGKSLSMEVTGLKKDTAYHFRVCCRNDIGHSPYFAPEETITPGLKISPPSSPVGPLAILNMTNKTITLSWKPPTNTGGAELTAYIIEKRESTKKAWNRLETLEPHVTTYTVHNLTHTKEYFFRVFAENPAGLSPPLETEAAIKLTSTAVRPSPPTGPLEVVVTGPSSIVLAWGRPESDGGSPILGYTVAMKNVRRIMWMEVGQVDGETQRLQVKDLQEGSEYMVRIMARNEVGISDPLEPEDPVKVIRPAGVIVEPGRPSGPLVISDVQTDSVCLSWKPPSEDGGGNILGYLIEAKDFLHVDIHKTYFWSDGPQTEYVVKDLQTSHIYQFRVYAQNEAGRGEALLNKNVIRMKAASKKPPAPSKPLVEIQDDESVLLQWTVPEGLSDVNFIIERFESKSGLWMQCNHEVVVRKSYLVTELVPGKEYKFRISCENIYGVGSPGEESDLIKLKESGGEPPTVTVPVTDSFVKVDDNAFFSCEFVGSQPMTVNWSKDGIRVREGLGASITTEATKSTLTLEEVDSDDDECLVQCDLRNAQGKASSQANIKILCPPRISCPSSYKDGLTYDEGDNLRLKATFTGKPTPAVRWLFNDEEPTLDERMAVSRQAGSMEVRICELKQTDAGSYEFVAENVMGKDAVSINVTITGPPSPPSGVPSLEVISEDEYLLKWNIPLQDGGSSVFNYIVEIKKDENDEWQRFATARDTYLEITDTSALEKSVFRIRAVNIYGTSEPSEQCHLSIGSLDGLESVGDKTLLSENECPVIQETGIEELDSQWDVTQSSCQPDLVNIGEIFSEEKVRGKFSRQVSFAESHELEPECTLTIMYVGTQTLISVPILNYACSDVYDFDEITHFAAEVLPPKEYAIQNIDNILCYTICWFTTVLESYYSSHILQDQSLRVSDYTVNFYDCSLQNYLPSCYDFASGEYIWNVWSLKDKARFIEEYVEIIDVKEFVYSNICLSLTDLNRAEVTTHCNYKDTIFMSLHPLVFECLLPFIADTVFKHNLTVNYQLHNSIVVFEALFLHGTALYEVKDEIKRAISVIHISEEFETLAGSKCVPMTSFKPALSVLPMSRTAVTEPRQKYEVSKKADFPVQTKQEKFQLCSLPRQSSRTELFDKILDDSDTCIKCGMTDSCLCSILDDEIGLSYEIDRYGIQVNRLELPSTSENVTKQKDHSSETGFTENIPDWLRFVSPFYLCAQETTNVNALDLDDLKSPSRDLTAESEISKSCLKDRSVQELLNLAEEVERSFSEKAEHIESLENILHEEITSLEKDLEAVHVIHRTFWNESLVPWINPDPLNEQVTEASEGTKTIEKDLIDFKMDVPSVKNEKEKQEEYAPQIITHLQNRVVQCGNRTRLYCSISGKPDPQIAWLKNGKLLSQNSRYVISNLVEFGLYIDIYNAKSTDSGEYMCIATNCHGSAQTQAYVRVVGHREYSPEEPKFLSSPDDVTVAEGDTVTLEWKVSGTPVPHVMWFKNTERIETSLRIDTLSNHRGCCRLVLHDVTQEDGAIYTCYLDNEAGSSVSTVLVNVSDGPKVSERSPEVDSMLNDLLSPANDSNIPSLKYYERLLSNRGISPSYEKSRKRSRKSKKGVRDVPGPPFAPRILNSGKTWVILSWSAPTNRIGNTNDVLYLIERRLLDDVDWKEVARTRHTLLTVAGLKSGQSYVFRIWAGNKNGWGPPAMLTQPAHCQQDITEVTKYTIM